MREEEGIIIESDQQLTKETGEKLDSASLHSLITVYDGNSNQIEFEASIDSTARKITIVISFPIDSEKYIVEIDSINNESGLRSAKFISQAYEFHKNAPPLLSNIQKTGFEKQKITISPSDFSNAFSDEENDPIEFLKIIKTPQNGVLYNNNNVILEENATLTLDEIDNLVYEPNIAFIGEDSVVWNSFDGIDFSSENALINLRIDAITGLKDEESSSFLLYPNPARDQITSIIQNNYSGIYRYILTNINGRVLKKFEIDKDSEELDYSISLNGLTRGIYLLQINGNGFSTTQKVLKK